MDRPLYDWSGTRRRMSIASNHSPETVPGAIADAILPDLAELARLLSALPA
jgi:hypothetical protein